MPQLGWRAGRSRVVFFLTVPDGGGWIFLSVLVGVVMVAREEDEKGGWKGASRPYGKKYHSTDGWYVI
jgi:hypothetical protein